MGTAAIRRAESDGEADRGEVRRSDRSTGCVGNIHDFPIEPFDAGCPTICAAFAPQAARHESPDCYDAPTLATLPIARISARFESVPDSPDAPGLTRMTYPTIPAVCARMMVL